MEPDSPSKILVIEDEAEILQLMGLLLKRGGYAVELCASAEDGVSLLRRETPDLIIVDWMLPGMSGLEMIKRIRQTQETNVPILMITAKADTASVISGLEAGADDYMTKPFEPILLGVRVQALLRRKRWLTQADSRSTEAIALGPFTFDFQAHRLLGPEGEVNLTASEFKLLSVLARQQGRVFSRKELILSVQGEGVNVTGRTVDTHVFTLRKKLGTTGEFIETVRGIGYRMAMLQGDSDGGR